MSPQGTGLHVPGHSKLCEQNMGWEVGQAGPVPGGPPPLPSAGKGEPYPDRGTSWERSKSCRECCPHKSPGDAASRHLPHSLGRVPRGIICPVSLSWALGGALWAAKPTHPPAWSSSMQQTPSKPRLHLITPEGSQAWHVSPFLRK